MIDKEFLKDLTVLYAEDDDLIRKELHETFSSIFKKIITACDGKEALEKFQENSIDLIVSDIVMPNMNGIEFLEEVRKSDKNIPFIFTTAYTDENYLITGLKQGVNDYFIKPLHITDLLIRIQDLAKKALKKKNIYLLQNETKEYLESINKVAMVIIFDENKKVIYINDFYKDLSKYDEKEVLGKNFEDLYHNEIAKSLIEDQFNTVLKEGNSWKGKLKFHAKDDNTFYTNCSIIPISKNDKKKKYISVNFITTKEETSRREFKKKVLYNYNETKKIFKKAQDKIDELTLELENYKDVEQKEIELNELKAVNLDYLNKILDLEKRLKDLRKKYGIFTTDVNTKIKNISMSASGMKNVSEKKDKKISFLKREISVKDYYIGKITVELDNEKKKTKDLEDVLNHRRAQVEANNVK